MLFDFFRNFLYHLINCHHLENNTFHHLENHTFYPSIVCIQQHIHFHLNIIYYHSLMIRFQGLFHSHIYFHFLMTNRHFRIIHQFNHQINLHRARCRQIIITCFKRFFTFLVKFRKFLIFLYKFILHNIHMYILYNKKINFFTLKYIKNNFFNIC